MKGWSSSLAMRCASMERLARVGIAATRTELADGISLKGRGKNCAIRAHLRCSWILPAYQSRCRRAKIVTRRMDTCAFRTMVFGLRYQRSERENIRRLNI